jgi:hypothetical protein
MIAPETSCYPDTRVNAPRLHVARLARLRAQLRSIGCAGALLYDPTNIRCTIRAATPSSRPTAP